MSKHFPNIPKYPRISTKSINIIQTLSIQCINIMYTFFSCNLFCLILCNLLEYKDILSTNIAIMKNYQCKTKLLTKLIPKEYSKIITSRGFTIREVFHRLLVRNPDLTYENLLGILSRYNDSKKNKRVGINGYADKINKAYWNWDNKFKDSD